MRTFPYGTQQRCIHRRDKFFGWFFFAFLHRSHQCLEIWRKMKHARTYKNRYYASALLRHSEWCSEALMAQIGGKVESSLSLLCPLPSCPLPSCPWPTQCNAMQWTDTEMLFRRGYFFIDCPHRDPYTGAILNQSLRSNWKKKTFKLCLSHPCHSTLLYYISRSFGYRNIDIKIQT